MPRLAANLTMLFTEYPFPDRIGAAAEAGFRAVECLFPYAHDADVLRQELERHDLDLVLFNLPPGDWNAGDRGLAALPERREEFRESLPLALDYAGRLNCSRLHVLAGVAPEGGWTGGHRDLLLENLELAANQAADRGIDILLEPLNQRDVPGYFYSRTREAVDIITALGCPNVKLQLDLYHRQITEGDLVSALHEYRDIIGHIQIAGVPGRREPDTGEVKLSRIFQALDEIGYDGFIGCEYHPADGTIAGLRWAKVHLHPAGEKA